MKLVLSVILCLMMTGCNALPAPMEMGDMVFIRTLGVDGGEDEVTLTASTGRRARGLQREVEPPLILNGADTSISGGMQAVESGCDHQVFYGYLDQLILGEGYCKSGIRPVLEYFARDVELGLGTEVWTVVGAAADAIQSGGEDGVDSRLDSLQQEENQWRVGMTRTVGETLTDILEDGSTYLPRLVTEGETLRWTGYTITMGDVSVGTVTGEGARGLELLEGQPSGDVFVGSGGLVVNVWGADCQFAPIFQGDTLAGVSVEATINADLREYHQKPTQEELDILKQELCQQEGKRIVLTLSQLQSLGADAIGLERQLGMASPDQWEKIQRDWENRFGDLEFTVNVDVTMERG